ncbi:Translocator protein, partial [Lacticaseibacillus paracasei subsp. paracasei CNCM I-4648]
IYTSLKLPPLSPPAAVFGPVWIILYLLIGVAGYLVIKDTTSRTQKNHQSQSFWQSTASKLHLEHRVFRRQ